ncbi:hypothetical protein X801_05142 [Opisthorchis viverrini]|uniref:Reverse transcriptase/retrotransposon-derived protein RNase H-like domain-containing protein n=1 Tax=Opisthorchis viverrini TaxID=6198 RepID=A0A1S8WX10_OPIVI|nr:hypothetical protein X801_05142 [Opisthorchis viverrini]
MFGRLPTGIHSAPSIFQCTTENFLSGIPKILVYLEDILITRCTMQERLESFKLTMNKEECNFLADQVDYLGFRINADSLAPLAKKIRPILGTSQTGNKHELQSYAWLITMRATTSIHLLNYFLRHEISWIWNHEQQKAFQRAKRALKSPPVLTHFDSAQPIVLSCGDSPFGVGVVLSQKSLFEILGENKPMPLMTPPRMQRLALNLVCYRYHLTCAPGQANYKADVLSRLSSQDVPFHIPKPAELGAELG